MLRQATYKSLLLVLLVVLSHRTEAAVVEQLIAVVNGEPYTLSNLSAYAKRKLGRDFPSADLNQINAGDRDVLEQFVTDKLLEAEVREAGIVITDDDVTRYIDQVKQNNSLSDADLKVALGREGMTPAAYRASVKSEMEKSEIIDRQVRRKVNITDEDVERYYKLNAKNYRANERARIRHILLALAENAPPERVQSAMATAKDVYQRIAAGEDFAALAREYSEGAGRAEGGEIGWVNRGTLISGIEEVAFEKLSVGQVSEPFRTSMGVHIVKETPFEEEDPNSPLKDKSIVSVFGVPLFTTDAVEDAPDILNPPPNDSGKGVFSTILDSLNPFSSKKP